MTLKFIQITDLHLTGTDEPLYGINTTERLSLCLRHVFENHLDAEFVVITGDLVHKGAEAGYVLLKEKLAEAPIPVHLLLGNHDSRITFRAAFPDAPLLADRFVQGSSDTRHGRFIFLDSSTPGEAWGSMCNERLSWLAERIDTAPKGGAFLFCHHPPFPVGIAKMDSIYLRDADALRECLIPRKERIRHLFVGHLHRPVSGSWLGIPFSTVRGISHQIGLDFSGSDQLKITKEAPSYAVVLVSTEHVVVHTCDFLGEAGSH